MRPRRHQFADVAPKASDDVQRGHKPEQPRVAIALLHPPGNDDIHRDVHRVFVMVGGPVGLREWRHGFWLVIPVIMMMVMIAESVVIVVVVVPRGRRVRVEVRTVTVSGGLALAMTVAECGCLAQQ
jgi:hypothetical protein